METEDGKEIRDGSYVRTSIGNGMLYVLPTYSQKDGIIFDADETESDGDLHHEWRNSRLR
jgi:hypothetical protein